MVYLKVLKPAASSHVEQLGSLRPAATTEQQPNVHCAPPFAKSDGGRRQRDPSDGYLVRAFHLRSAKRPPDPVGRQARMEDHL